MKPVVWLDRALDDLTGIGKFISNNNPETAFRIVKAIKASADSLSTHPETGRPGRVDGTRELIVPKLPYILTYRIMIEEVQILSVMHTSRKWPDTFE